MLSLLLLAALGASTPAWTPSRGPFIADAGPDFVEVRWSLANSAHTLPVAGGATRFVVFGDTRTDDAAHSKVAARIAAAAPDFVVNTGDLIDNGTIEAIWPRFFNAERGLLAQSLYLPAAGNHDERSLFNDSTMRRYFPRAPYFRFDVGAVRLIFLDTNRSYDPGSAQGMWLRTELETARADRAAGRLSWIAMVHHHPPFSTGEHGSDATAQRELVPLYETFGVDVVFCGHDHLFERLERNGIVYYVTGGGGAPLYQTTNVIPESRVNVRAYHYLQVEADRQHLTVAAIDTDGNVLDRQSLAAGRLRPVAPPPAASDALPFAASAGAFVGAAAFAWWWSGRSARAQR